jgi:hypothetical protein
MSGAKFKVYNLTCYWLYLYNIQQYRFPRILTKKSLAKNSLRTVLCTPIRELRWTALTANKPHFEPIGNQLTSLAERLLLLAFEFPLKMSVRLFFVRQDSIDSQYYNVLEVESYSINSINKQINDINNFPTHTNYLAQIKKHLYELVLWILDNG